MYPRLRPYFSRPQCEGVHRCVYNRSRCRRHDGDISGFRLRCRQHTGLILCLIEADKDTADIWEFTFPVTGVKFHPGMLGTDSRYICRLTESHAEDYLSIIPVHQLINGGSEGAVTIVNKVNIDKTAVFVVYFLKGR